MSLAFLAQMGWKSAIIAGAALVILSLLRSRSAADRAAVLQLTVVSLLLLPAISLAVPSLQIARPLILDWLQPAPTTAGALSQPVAHQGPSLPLPLGRALILIYAAGALMLGARMAAGLITLAGWTRRSAAIASPEWSAGLARAMAAARIDRPVRLLASDRAPSPMSWGLVRPVILIDRVSLARTEDIDAILAHETAHVARRDWLVLVLSRLAVALFWFNPLVWLVEQTLGQEAEEAADRHAVERVEPVRYASALLACVRHARAGSGAIPANRIVPGRALRRRVDAILNPERRGTASGSALTVSAMAACVVLSAPVAALELVPAKAKAAHPPSARLASRTPARSPGVQVHTRRGATGRSATPQDGASAAASTDAEEDDVDVDVDVDVDLDIDGAELARLGPRLRKRFSDRQLELRGPGQRMAEARTAELPDRFARAIADARSEAERQKAIESRVFGITDADRRDYAELGYANLGHDELVEMAVHHVSPKFIRDMAAAGYPGLTPKQLVKMRIFGVSPDNARQAAASQNRPSPDALIKMKIMGALLA